MDLSRESMKQGGSMPQLEDCKRELLSMFSSGLEHNQVSLEISAGHLHRRVFGDGPDWVSLCCAAMREQYDAEADAILCGEIDETSAEFTIEYRLPRPGGAVDVLQME
jgi:hypothetical protein